MKMRGKLAYSNLAWKHNDDGEAAAILGDHGIHGIELAPTKIWSCPTEVTTEKLKEYRSWWESRGFKLVALQSLLFGRGDLELFGSQEKRSEMSAYLKRMVDLASILGAGILVFGSPKNRARRGLPLERACEIAVPFFRELGEYALRRKAILCIEPNAVYYGCDFVTTSEEGARLVRSVNSEGFRLHLDLGCMQLEGEPVEQQVTKHADITSHFHLSAKDLGPIGEEQFGMAQDLARVLWAKSPDAWFSVEMKEPPNGLDGIRAVLESISMNDARRTQ